jgi:hypothetical protein
MVARSFIVTQERQKKLSGIQCNPVVPTRTIHKGNIMAKINFKPNPHVHQIFDDLDEYRDFCTSHGRVFNEAALYDERERDYYDFLKFKERGYTRNNWNWINSDRKPGERKPGGERPRTNPGSGGYKGNNFRSNYSRAGGGGR